MAAADPGRPLITLSYAQSLDGCLTSVRGKPTALSGDESSRATHIVRSSHDGILVGIGTVLADNPRLSVRLVDGPDPVPVILDTRLRLPLSCRMITDGRHPIIACGSGASRSTEEDLVSLGAKVIRLTINADGRLPLDGVLSSLIDEGISSMMVEGGVETLSSFIAAGLWDRAVVTVVPRWLGGYGWERCSGISSEMYEVIWIPAGKDVLCLGRRAA